MMARWWTQMCFLLCLFASASAAFAIPAFVPPEPKDYEQLSIYLHTIEVNDEIYNNFGHTALRVVDPSHNLDMVFNWGIFDFRDPMTFSFRFFKGILNYELGIYPFSAAQRRYQIDGRTVWEDKLNLNVEQKKILMRRLIWNAQPENRTYAYLYFFDNCSTRPRDYINEALGGALKDQYVDQMMGETFRDMVWQHYATNPEVALSLDILMNSRIDREMSFWQKMFLPKTLRAGLVQFPVELAVTGKHPLVSETTILHEFPVPQPGFLHGYAWVWLLSILPLGFVVWEYAQSYRKHKEFVLSQRGLRTFGFFTLIYGLYTGLLGLLMVVTWAFSAHLDLHHNANLLLFLPTDLFLVWLGGRWLFKGRAPTFGSRFGFWLTRYGEAHLLGIVLLAIVSVTGIITQNVTRVLIYMAPLSALLWCIFLWGNTIQILPRDD